MSKKKETRTAYLGKNINVEWNGESFILFDCNAVPPNMITLNIDTWLALTRFVKSLENE